MFRVAHVADAHFQNRKQILAEIVKCADFAVNEIRKEEPDLIALAGDTLDFYNSPDGIELGSPAALAATKFIYELGMIAPVAIVKGTPSHDGNDSLIDFARLKTVYPIYVSESLEQILYCPDDGFISINSSESGYCCEKAQAIISFLPAVNKASVVANLAGSKDETTKETVNLMRDIFQMWGMRNEQATRDGLVTIVIGHGTVIGAQFSSGQLAIGKDVEFTLGDLLLANIQLGCLGHIHKEQNWKDSGYWIGYSGDLTRLDHGETEEKGFYIHELNGRGHTHKWIQTPARSMKTKRPEGLPTAELLEGIEEGEVVRIVYTVSEEDRHRVDEKELERIALEMGAAEIKFERTIVPVNRIRAAGISHIKGLYDKLAKWAEATATTLPEGTADKLNLIETTDNPDEIVQGLYGGAA
jgi:exonuclease SbcD